MLPSGVKVRVSNKILVDSLEGTVVCEYNPMACQQMIIQLYIGVMKVYTNRTNMYIREQHSSS
jgi:hypothetical protein